MTRDIAILAALLIASAPAFGQTSTTTQPAANAQGQVQPKPEGDTATSNTGGVTTTGKENLPDIGATTGVQPAAGAPSTQVSMTEHKVVDPALVKEIYDSALAAQKAAAAAAPPPPQKTDEQKQKEAAVIARHREAYEARIQERLKAIPQG